MPKTNKSLILQPLIPMEPVSTAEIPEGNGWGAQLKWDGVRMLTYCNGDTVRLFNRKLRERTFHYPEFSSLDNYCTARSVILDGEIIALGNDGKPSFHQVMKRDGIRRPDRFLQIQRQVPVIYMVFDVLFYNGEWIKTLPFFERMRILDHILRPRENLQIVTTHDSPELLFEAVKIQDLEGIVVKKLDSPYLIGEKRSYWQKLKNYQDLIAVIGGYTLRGDTANSLLLGLYDEKRDFRYIGHAGTGKLNAGEWRELTRMLRLLTIAERPFSNRPERGESIWVNPQLTVKIQFMEWTESNYLRQPSIQALVDVPPGECRFP
jgi:bifunctional non-homologous end joining protein LigD